jgi:hypothetical protein
MPRPVSLVWERQTRVGQAPTLTDIDQIELCALQRPHTDYLGLLLKLGGGRIRGAILCGLSEVESRDGIAPSLGVYVGNSEWG